jgi:serine/threonine protein phosphatase PrpC
MDIVFGAKTDVGLKREHNEDSLCADPKLGLFIVCDGMGGRNAGEIASGLAVEIIQKHMSDAHASEALPLIGAANPKLSPHTNRLASAVRLANQVVNGASQSKPGQSGMGTTVVCALLNGPMLSVAHAGDSRIYLVRGENIHALTADHSLVAEQVRQGILTEEQAEKSAQKNIVTRALGVEESLQVDLDEIELVKGDVILLCSDGLTKGVKPVEIMRVLREEKEPQAACDRFIKLANAAGGEDNTTVIVIMVRKVGTGVWQQLMKRVTS